MEAIEAKDTNEGQLSVCALHGASDVHDIALRPQKERDTITGIVLERKQLANVVSFMPQQEDVKRTLADTPRPRYRNPKVRGDYANMRISNKRKVSPATKESRLAKGWVQHDDGSWTPPQATCVTCYNQYGMVQYDTRCPWCRRRVQRYNVRTKARTDKFYESIDPWKVFQEEDYTCRHCGCEVTLWHEHRRCVDTTATLDHKVPLNRGGAHERSNVQTLCHRCNTYKNDGFRERERFQNVAAYKMPSCLCGSRRFVVEEVDPNVWSVMCCWCRKVCIGTTMEKAFHNASIGSEGYDYDNNLSQVGW